jgi:hypothetical protein
MFTVTLVVCRYPMMLERNNIVFGGVRRATGKECCRGGESDTVITAASIST